jgi:hypothetical protein
MSYPIPPNRNPSKYWEQVQAHLTSLGNSQYANGKLQPMGDPKKVVIKPPEEGTGSPQKGPSTR